MEKLRAKQGQVLTCSVLSPQRCTSEQQFQGFCLMPKAGLQGQPGRDKLGEVSVPLLRVTSI